MRMSNHVAVQFYEGLGYKTYRQVIEYYAQAPGLPIEDALDMRKSLSRDPEKLSMVPVGRKVRPEECVFH